MEGVSIKYTRQSLRIIGYGVVFHFNLVITVCYHANRRMVTTPYTCVFIFCEAFIKFECYAMRFGINYFSEIRWEVNIMTNHQLIWPYMLLLYYVLDIMCSFGPTMGKAK